MSRTVKRIGIGAAVVAGLSFNAALLSPFLPGVSMRWALILMLVCLIVVNTAYDKTVREA